jgi:hypothetical protein
MVCRCAARRFQVGFLEFGNFCQRRSVANPASAARARLFQIASREQCGNRRLHLVVEFGAVAFHGESAPASRFDCPRRLSAECPCFRATSVMNVIDTASREKEST